MNAIMVYIAINEMSNYIACIFLFAERSSRIFQERSSKILMVTYISSIYTSNTIFAVI